MKLYMFVVEGEEIEIVEAADISWEMEAAREGESLAYPVSVERNMSKGKKNSYTCGICKGQIITVDVDEGVTPFAIDCRATEGCNGLMYSAFYSIPQFLPAQYEWFKPDSVEGYGVEMKEHIQKGGLDLRAVHKG